MYNYILGEFFVSTRSFERKETQVQTSGKDNSYHRGELWDRREINLSAGRYEDSFDFSGQNRGKAFNNEKRDRKESSQSKCFSSGPQKF